jgi:hypothetical protein
MRKDRNKYDRPESYPKPTETDNQLKNQPEFIDEEPNTYTKEISNVNQPDKKEQDQRGNRDADADAAESV